MEGTIAEIRFFAGTFNPRTWAFCNGQIFSISTNTALFSLLGTTYGGNGQTTFALPDFQGRVAVGIGTGPGLPNYTLGQTGGSNSFTIVANQLPSHNHAVTGSITMNATASNGNNDAAQNNYPAAKSGATIYSTTKDAAATLVPIQHNLSLAPVGGNQPVTNIQPMLGMNFIICLFGIYPSRN